MRAPPTAKPEHELNIPATELDAGGKEFHFVIRPAWVRGVLENHEASPGGPPGTLHVRASKSGSDVVVRGTLDFELSIPCARCLEPAKLPLHSDISVMYVPASKMAPVKGEEIAEEEADTLPYDGDNVVLDDLVRDELVLEIPMIPLCSEACPGMSPAPDLNSGSGAGSGEVATKAPIDPRLAPLLAFTPNAKRKD